MVTTNNNNTKTTTAVSAEKGNDMQKGWLKNAGKMQEERLKEKKRRQEEKKKEEELKKEQERKRAEKKKKQEEARKEQLRLAKAREAEERKQAAAKDKADRKINQHLKEVMGGETVEEISSDEDDGLTRSPVKKKRGVSTSKGETSSKGAPSSKGGSSLAEILQTPKKVTPTQFSLKKMKTVDDCKHKHVVYILAELEVGGENGEKYENFHGSIAGIVTNMKNLDPSAAIYPSVGKEVITEVRQLSPNMTVMAKHIVITPKGRIGAAIEKYKVRKQWKKHPEGPDEFKDPKVEFTVVIGTDMNPKDFVHKLGLEFGRNGGQSMKIKPLKAYSTETFLVLHRFHTGIPWDVIIFEAKEILTKAREMGMAVEAEDNMGKVVGTWPAAPDVAVMINVPKVPGQNTSQFEGLSSQVSYARKAIHLDVNAEEKPYATKLWKIAKDNGIATSRWGKQFLATPYLKKDDINHIRKVCSVQQDHVNLQCSLMPMELEGITDIDKEVDIIDTDGKSTIGVISLRQILYDFVKMTDGSGSVFCQIHGKPMGPIVGVVPNTALAESMVLSMNENVYVFLLTYLTKEVDMPKDLVTRILKKSVDPVVYNEARKYTCDEKTYTVSLIDKEKDQVESLTNASWWQNRFEEDLAIKESKGKKGKKKGEYANAAMLYQMDDAKSVATFSSVPSKGGAVSFSMEDEVRTFNKDSMETDEEEEVEDVTPKATASNGSKAPSEDKEEATTTTTTNNNDVNAHTQGSQPVDELGKSSQKTTAKDVGGAQPDASAKSPTGDAPEASDASPGSHEAAGEG